MRRNWINTSFNCFVVVTVAFEYNPPSVHRHRDARSESTIKISSSDLVERSIDNMKPEDAIECVDDDVGDVKT